MQTHPGEFAVKVFAIFTTGEITTLDTPVGNRASNPVDNLLYARFTLGSPVLTIEILRHDDIRRERSP